jgi:hypothetical protein
MEPEAMSSILLSCGMNLLPSLSFFGGRFAGTMEYLGNVSQRLTMSDDEPARLTYNTRPL